MKSVWLIIIIVACFAFDQLSKRWAVKTLKEGRPAFELSVKDCQSYKNQYPHEPKRRVRKICQSRPIVRPVIDIIPGYFELEYAENRGAAFGTFADGKPWERFHMHAGSALGLIAFLVLTWAFRRAELFFPAVLTALCAAGAIGNIYDRATLGYVVDFVLWRYGDLEWPIFNVADSAISVGFFGLLGYALFAIFRQLYLRIRS